MASAVRRCLGARDSIPALFCARHSCCKPSLDLPLVYFATMQSWIGLHFATVQSSIGFHPVRYRRDLHPAWALQVKPCSVPVIWLHVYSLPGWPRRWTQLPPDEDTNGQYFWESGLSSPSFPRRAVSWIVTAFIYHLRMGGGASLSNSISSLSGEYVNIFSSLSSLCTWIWFKKRFVFFFFPRRWPIPGRLLLLLFTLLARLSRPSFLSQARYK